MRIHKLEIKNIASLKGRHHVNFDKIYEDTNLFAITGPTGSGKSTLLNCISLALYGEVYKKGSASQDFVTMGESEGEISLDFSHGEQDYHAHWKLKVKKKNGEHLKKPQLSRILYRINAGKKEALELSAQEIMNLSFAQFCKTSILNQGEFAKFLKSSFVERKEILEKFYEGENLSSLNSILRTLITEQQGSLENQEHQIKGILESISGIKVTEQEVNESKVKVDLYKQLTEQLYLVHEKVKDLSDYQVSFRNHLVKKVDLETKLRESQERLNLKLKVHKEAHEKSTKAEETLKIKQEILSTAVGKIEKRDIYQKQLNTSKRELSELSGNLLKVDRELAKQEEAYQHAHKVVREIQQNYPILNDFETQQISEYEQEYKSIINDLNKNQQNYSENIEKIKNLQKQMAELKEAIAARSNKISEINLSHLDDEKKQIEGKTYLFIQLLTKLSTSLKQKGNLENEINKLTKTQKETFKREKDQLETILALQKLKDSHLSHIEKFEQIKSINLCIEHSTQQGHCVVCGSKELNFQKGDLDIREFEQLKILLKSTEENILNEQAQYDQIKLKRLTFESEIKSLQSQIKQRNSELLIDWNKTDLPYVENVLKDSSLEMLSKRKIELDKRKEELTHQVEQKKELIHKQEIDENQLRQLQSLQDELNRENKNLLQFKQQKQREAKKIEENLKLGSDINENLVFLKYCRESALEKQKNIQLREMSELQINGYKKQKEEYRARSRHLEEAIKKIETEILAINQYLESENIDYDPAEKLESLRFSASTAKKESLKAQDELKGIEISHAELTSRFKTIEENIQQVLKQFDYAQEEVIKKAKEINIAENKNFQFIQKSLAKFQTLEVQAQDPSDLLTTCFAEYKGYFDQAKEVLREQTRELAENEVLFKQWSEAQKKVANLESHTQEVKKKLTNLQSLNILIGKDEFRNFVLSKIENLLIEQANIELEKLCDGRYRLYQTHKSNRQLSEFKILDHFHGGQERKISTLSGGETFLVSLALALALAEMTRGKTQIDSLFIDEGFGTLDHETIEDVLELLIDIQNSGKQIGIISHVQKLTSRIPVNIHLLKGTDGLSDIEIVMN